MAARIFVACDLRHGERCAPDLRAVLKGLRLDFVEHTGVDADVGEAHPSALQAARQ